MYTTLCLWNSYTHHYYKVIGASLDNNYVQVQGENYVRVQWCIPDGVQKLPVQEVGGAKTTSSSHTSSQEADVIR